MKTDKISLSANEKMTLVSNLSTMLSSGIPILESVDSLLDGAKKNQKKILEVLKEDLIQGKRVYASFSKFPRTFDNVAINIIKASEEAGTLDVTLKDLVAIIKKDIEFNDKIKSALVYPIFILIVFLGVLLMILIVVVPKISTVFSRLKVTLPLPTQIMLFMSNVLLKNTIPLAAVCALIAASFILLYKKNKKFVFGIFFSLPYVSQLAKEIDLTRFTRSLFLLLNAGIPITTALELSQDVVMKKDVAKAISHTKEIVVSGKKITDGFKLYKKIFPNVMIKIVEAGEKSGSLDKSMQDSSDYLDYQVTNTLRLVVSLIEPIMLVFVGVMVGGMMLAIIAPIYGLIGDIGAR